MAASFTTKFNEWLLHGIKKALVFMHKILCCTPERFSFILEALSYACLRMFSKGIFYFLSSCKIALVSSYPDVCSAGRKLENVPEFLILPHP
jgi:hypothetical protein